MSSAVGSTCSGTEGAAGSKYEGFGESADSWSTYGDAGMVGSLGFTRRLGCWRSLERERGRAF